MTLRPIPAVFLVFFVIQPFVSAAVSAANTAAVTPRLRAQDQKKIDEFKMITYQAVFVIKGPKWTDTAALRRRRSQLCTS